MFRAHEIITKYRKTNKVYPIKKKDHNQKSILFIHSNNVFQFAVVHESWFYNRLHFYFNLHHWNVRKCLSKNDKYFNVNVLEYTGIKKSKNCVWKSWIKVNHLLSKWWAFNRESETQKMETQRIFGGSWSKCPLTIPQIRHWILCTQKD